MGLPQGYELPQMDDTQVSVPFPATTKQAAGKINGVTTDVMCISFSDKIMITITQDGRLAQWVGRFFHARARLFLTPEKVTVPLSSDNPTHSDRYFHTTREGEDALLPAARFSPRTLLGAGTADREMMGQLYASQIANAIITKTPEESRSLMLGLGLASADMDRDVFLQVIDLVLTVL